MSESNETLAPEYLQIQLVSIYKSLPTRNAAGNRMSDSIGNSNLSDLPQETAEHYASLAVTESIRHTQQAELPSMKLALLQKLLDTAKITEVSKQYITESFLASFTFGADEVFEIYKLLGLTDEDRKEAGIFSNNPDSRKDIETGIAKEIQLDMTSMEKDYPDGSEAEEIEKHKKRLEEFKDQFAILYGMPVNLESPRD